MRASQKSGATISHLLSVVSHELGVTLTQQSVSDKTNEIPISTEILKAFDVSGKVITTDALLTQRPFCYAIIEGGGNYMLPVKDNQPDLLDAIEKLFQDIPHTLAEGTLHPILKEPIHIHETTEKSHGRLETRCLKASTSLNAYLEWPGIAQVIQYRWTDKNLNTGEETHKVHYGITSLHPEAASAERLLTGQRGHWSIENKSQLTTKSHLPRKPIGNLLEIYCSAHHKNFKPLYTISYNISMKNNEISQDNHPKELEYTMFQEEQILYDEMVDVLKEEFQKVKTDETDPDRTKKLSKCIAELNRLVRTKDAMCRRENIETRGYDTNARISEREHKQKQEAENNAKDDTSQQNPPPNEQTDTKELSDEEPQALTHLHPDMEQYESALPKQDDKKETGRSDLRIATTTKQPRIATTPKQKPPVLKYNPNGFRPHGQMRDLFKSHESIKIAGGTYDAGKTFSCVAYIDQLARKYPGARLTFIHRSLNRVYKNIIPTYEKYLGFRPKSRADPNPTPITKYGGEHPDFFEYWNGSRIYMNGLDKPQNLLSDFFDAAFVNQAELVTFDTWDELTARVSERAGTMPIAFLLGDCNPSTPNHWIRQQTKAGKLTYFELTFRDNPEIYDQQTGELTENGKRRVQRLQNLEGLRYKRGYEGKWASGEGLVFDTFIPEVHVIDNFTISPQWARYISIDWGFRNPSCCIWWARSPDDRIYAYKEIYKTKLTKPDFIRMIKANCDTTDRIRYAAVDSADQDAIEQLRRAGFRVNQPKKSRATQIDAIKERLKVDETGAPAIFFLRDRLVHPPDEDLKDTYRPLEVTDEFLSCVYDENVSGTNKDDEAIKGDNHGIDSTAYLILSLQNNRRTIGSGRVIDAAIQMG